MSTDYQGFGLPVDIDDADPPEAPPLSAHERQARAFLQAHGATYPAALDPGLRVANRFGFKRAPYTIIVNKRGEITARLEATTDEARLAAAIEAAIKPPARRRPPTKVS